MKLNDPTLYQIGEKTLPKPKLITKTFAKEKVNFVLGIDSKASVLLLNSQDDVDDLGIYGEEEDSLLSFNKQKTWLRYLIKSEISAQTGVSISNVGFSIDGKADLAAFAYRIHQPDEELTAALLKDITELKSIFSLPELKELALNEVVGLNYGGSLSASLEFSWKDMISTNVSWLSDLLIKDDLVKINIGPSASIKLGVSISDTFKISLIKRQNDFQLRINKIKNRESTIGGSLKVSVGFDKPDDLEKAAKDFIAYFLQLKTAEVTELVQKKYDELSSGQKELLKQFSSALNLEKVDYPFKELQEKIKTGLHDAVNLKLEAALTVDFTRTKTSTAVFEATLNEEALEKLHLSILKADTSALVKAYREEAPGITDVKFLGKDVLEKVVTWGLTLGLGKWNAGFKDEVDVEMTSVENESGDKMVAYGRVSKYEESFLKWKTEWAVDLSATMRGFSRTCYTNEFDFAYAVKYSWVVPKVEQDDLVLFLDQAVIWGVINKAEQTSLLSDNDLKNCIGQKINFSTTLKFNPEIFEPMLLLMGREDIGGEKNPNRDLFCYSLGKAMPYWKGFPIREDSELRAMHYGNLWKKYFADADGLPKDAVVQYLRQFDKKLADAEDNYQNTSEPRAFQLIRNNAPDVPRRWQTFAMGASRLKEANAVSASISHELVIPKSFRQISKLRGKNNPIMLKALGVYLSTIASNFPHLKSSVERSALISGDNGDIVIAQAK